MRSQQWERVQSKKKQGLVSGEIIALAGAGADDLWARDAGWPQPYPGRQGDNADRLRRLPDDNIRSLLEAHDGSLWIGTTHGLAHLKMTAGQDAITAANIHTFTTADGLAVM